MLRLDLTDVNNLRAVEIVKVRSAATLVCKKAKTTHAIEVQKFKTNARNFLVALGQKIERKVPITLQIHSIHFFTLTNPNCCRKSLFLDRFI